MEVEEKKLGFLTAKNDDEDDEVEASILAPDDIALKRSAVVLGSSIRGLWRRVTFYSGGAEVSDAFGV